MSQNGQSAVSSAPISLFANPASLSNQLLKDIIGHDLGSRCHLRGFNIGQITECNSELVLANCRDIERIALEKWLYDSSKLPSVALINVPRAVEWGRLIHWPNITGLFFDDVKEVDILYGIRRILAGELWLPRKLLLDHLQSARSFYQGNHSDTLTIREQEILLSVMRGLSNNEVADQHSVSENTVKSHLYNIYRKVGATNRIEACDWGRVNLM